MVFNNDNLKDFIDPELVKIIIQLLWRIQGGKCKKCGVELSNYNVHHKRYGEDITLYDLELFCKKCHLENHGKRMIKESRNNVFIPICATQNNVF